MSNLKTLQVSFAGIELHDPSYYTQDLGCYIQLTSPDGQQKFMDVVILSDQSNKANIPIGQLDHKIQFIIKRMSLNQVIGSVSIQVSEFHQVSERSWPQWLTLFENLNDDDYDGQLFDENDEELPRVQLHFGLLEYEVKSASPSPLKKSVVLETSQQQASPNQQVHSPNFDNNSFNFGISESASPQVKKFIAFSDAQVQANIQTKELQQLNKARLELEKMTEFKKKYDHSKAALQKMQKEYMDLLALYNQTQEDLKHTLHDQNHQIKTHKIHISDLTKQNHLLQSEIEVLKKINAENNYLSSTTFQQQDRKPQASDMASRLVIEDMNKQIRALQFQLENCTELKEKNEERLQQLTKTMTEQILQQKDEKFLFLQELQKIESQYSQQQDIIRQLNEKSSRLTLQLKQKNDEKLFLEKEVVRLNKECQHNQKKILDLSQFIQTLKESNIECQEKFQEQWNQQNSNYNALESEKVELEQTLDFKTMQLNQYCSIVGPIDDYFALQARCQQLQMKKNDLQEQLNHYMMDNRQKSEKKKQDDEIQKQKQKDHYIDKIQYLQSQNKELESSLDTAKSQIKLLQTEIIKLTGIFQQIKGENTKLSNIAFELDKTEIDKENLSSQLYQTTEELIVHHCSTNKPLTVESQLEELVQRLYPPIKFVKQRDNKYKFGSQNLELFMHKNKLMVRHESRDSSILQFLKTYLVQEIFLKNNGKIDPLYIQEWQNRMNELCLNEEEEERPLQRHPNWSYGK